jgi:polyisoprenoid-binding protein YceI
MFKKLFLFVLILGFFNSVSAQENWKIDNGHSNINFEVSWLDFSMRTGEFKVFDGEIVCNSWEDLSDATFTLKVDANSIDVIAENLSEQLKGERFLETEKYPDITFHSSGAKKTAENTYTTVGKLNIHGVEKEQEVHIVFKGQTTSRRSYVIGIEVSLELNRNDFGLTWGSPRLGEKVKVVGYLLYQMRMEEE